MTHNTKWDPVHLALQQQMEYRKQIAKEFKNTGSSTNELGQMIYANNTILVQNRKMLLDTMGAIGDLQEDLTFVKKQVAPKKKIKHKPEIQRDPITDTIFQEILAEPKPQLVSRRVWARFKVASAVLFYTGLRVNEVRSMTKEMIHDCFVNNKCNFYQHKVNSIRTLTIPAFYGFKYSQIEDDVIYLYRRAIKCR